MEKRTVICNMCGKEFDRYDLEQGVGLGGRLGYGSVYDGRRYALDFCCDCFDNILSRCVVSPLEDDCVTLSEDGGPTGWKITVPRAVPPVQMTFDPDGNIHDGND